MAIGRSNLEETRPMDEKSTGVGPGDVKRPRGRPSTRRADTFVARLI